MVYFMNYIFDFRLIASESVQYFQFDKEGNMYVFAPGAGFSGESKIVRPGDDIFVDESMYNTWEASSSTLSLKEESVETSPARDIKPSISRYNYLLIRLVLISNILVHC